MADYIDRQKLLDAVAELKESPWFNDAPYHLIRKDALECVVELAIKQAPAADVRENVKGEWTTHEVACLLADMFNDSCACNYNGIDEWLPEVCEAIDSCPHPVGVACWEQFVTHRMADMRGEHNDKQRMAEQSDG